MTVRIVTVVPSADPSVYPCSRMECDARAVVVTQSSGHGSLWGHCGDHLPEGVRTADAWPTDDVCSDCGDGVSLVLVDLAAASASGWAQGDPLYVHAAPVNPDEPERCDTGSSASTARRDVGE